jgi:CHAT domain-containing protein/tetratricopeptide (TPR) repeat protein
MPSPVAGMIRLALLTGLGLALALAAAAQPVEDEPDPQELMRQAKALSDEGAKLYQRGRHREATERFRQVLSLQEKLYPKTAYPHGHPDLARTLGWLGVTAAAHADYAAARRYAEHSVALWRALAADKRFASPAQLATALNNLAYQCKVQGDYPRAEALYREALTIQRKAFPAERYPEQQRTVAVGLHNLGIVLHLQGELDRAEEVLRESMALKRKLLPNGHATVATTLDHLGAVLTAQRKYREAESCSLEALGIYRKVFAEERFLAGSLQVAACVTNLGHLKELQGDYGPAEAYYREAVSIFRKRYPAERFPRGHPELATGLHNLSVMLQLQDKLAEAVPLCREALEQKRKLYPSEDYPQGHPHLADTLHVLGMQLLDLDRPEMAEPVLREALTMFEGLNEQCLCGVAEAQALNRLARLPKTRDAYLTATRGRPDQTEAAYGFVWRGKALVARTLQRRRRLIGQSADPETRALDRELTGVRQALAQLLVAPGGGGPDQPARLRELTERKEDLERRLAQRLPAVAAWQAQDRLTPADLQARLPAGTAFVDLLRYTYRHVEADAKVPGREHILSTPHYVAFVIERGRPIRRVELGPAASLEEVVSRWRQDLVRGKNGDAAKTVRRLLWEPLAKHFARPTQAVYLGPDGSLTTLPWAALPGAARGTVLLEEHALAVVPSGPFLLDRLATASRPVGREDVLLLLGGADYDHLPGVKVAPAPVKKRSWPYLPATVTEITKVQELAGKRAVHVLRAAEAGPAQVLTELPQARWAHLATHGFFADKKLRSVFQLDEKAFQRGAAGELRGLGARSPLVLSGMVLAGANRPQEENPGGGILTAEALAGLDLDRLELIVLSACETGLGEVAGGEGVFGLQRAFHLAGAQNVVASLWKVDDEATAALMGLFYHKLWRDRLPPLEALRQAQLTLYRHPERIGRLARARGPDFEKEADLPVAAAAVRAPARLWAGFVLSGTGR